MIRTQIYIPEVLHRKLMHIAKTEDVSMAKVARDILEEGTKERKKVDRSGIKTLEALSKLGFTGGPKDLSENLDHYLYGAPKKK